MSEPYECACGFNDEKAARELAACHPDSEYTIEDIWCDHESSCDALEAEREWAQMMKEEPDEEPSLYPDEV